MNQPTLHHWIIIPPFSFKESLKMKLSEGELMIQKGWKPNTRTSLEFILRSIYNEPVLINQRFYYLLHYAKSQDEKIRCLASNILDMEQQLRYDKKTDQFYNTLIMMHSFYLAEVYWEVAETRKLSEEIWLNFYSDNQKVMEIIHAQAVILNRIPLFTKTKKKFREILFNLPDDSALYTYAKALLLYSEDNLSKKAKEMLKLSIQLNPHVPEYILTKKRIPKKPQKEIEPGQISEAMYIGFLSGEAWWSVKGAVPFLKNLVNSK